MKNFLTKFIFSALFSVVALALTHAQNGPKLSIQGVLRKTDGGAVVDNTYKLTFKLWDAPTGGNEIYKEVMDVDVKGGIYSALLGSTQTLTAPFDKPYYLGVSVGNNQTELLPRAQLSSAPYTLAIQGESNVFPSSGPVGIGTKTVSADAKLQVEGSIRVANDENIYGLNNIKGFNDLHFYGDPNGGPDLTIDAAGNANFSGAVSGGNANFSGTISAGNANFSGAVSAGNANFSGSVSGNGFKDGNFTFDMVQSPFHPAGTVLGSIGYFGKNMYIYEYAPGGLLLSPAANNEGAIGLTQRRWQTMACDHLYYNDFNLLPDNPDEFKKGNIPTLGNSLSKIKKLRGIQYTADSDAPSDERGEKTRQKQGFVPEEFKEVFPDMVEYLDEIGSYSFRNLHELFPVLIEGIKEQQQIIDAQQEKIDKIMRAMEKAGIKMED